MTSMTKRHELVLNNLEAYAKDGSQPEDDLKSLHAASLFSTRSASDKTVSVKHSSNRSHASQQSSHRPSTKHREDNTSVPSQGDKDSVSHRSQPPPSIRDTTSHVSQAASEKLSETRIQAEIAKRQFEQERMTQQANQLKLDMERRAAQQRRDLDAQQDAMDLKQIQMEAEAAKQ